MKRLFALMIALTLLAGLYGVQAEEGVTILITAVGDCTLGGVANHTASSEKLFAGLVDKNGYDYFFKNVMTLFEADDFTIVNLEGPLTTAKDYYGKANYYFRGRPSDAKILSSSGVEVANVANNHIFNFGQAGFDETLEALAAENVGACGYDVVYYAQKDGITVGFVGFDQWLSTNDDIRRVISEVRPNCDLLIASYHGGIENTHSISDAVRTAGRLMIDLGADLVIGNHSHMYSGVEKYKGKYIIGSLGNFCFGGNLKPKEYSCAIFRQAFTINADGSVEDAGIDIIPAQVGSRRNVNDCQPSVMTSDYEGEHLFNAILRLSNFRPRDVKWLSDSYAVAHGLDKNK